MRPHTMGLDGVWWGEGSGDVGGWSKALSSRGSSGVALAVVVAAMYAAMVDGVRDMHALRPGQCGDAVAC